MLNENWYNPNANHLAQASFRGNLSNQDLSCQPRICCTAKRYFPTVMVMVMWIKIIKPTWFYGMFINQSGDFMGIDLNWWDLTSHIINWDFMWLFMRFNHLKLLIKHGWLDNSEWAGLEFITGKIIELVIGDFPASHVDIGGYLPAKLEVRLLISAVTVKGNCN